MHQKLINKNGTDLNISMISNCRCTSMDECEIECARYYTCNTIALANDLLHDFELSNCINIKENN